MLLLYIFYVTYTQYLRILKILNIYIEIPIATVSVMWFVFYCFVKKWPAVPITTYSAGTVFIRQNLTDSDV